MSLIAALIIGAIAGWLAGKIVHGAGFGLIGNIAESIAREIHARDQDREELAYNLNLVVTEAVTNAIRHGRPSRIRIELAVRRNILELSIRDNGQGFGAEPGDRAGLGQRTMRYRAARAGGTIVSRDTPGGGALVLVRVRRFVV